MIRKPRKKQAKPPTRPDPFKRLLRTRPFERRDVVPVAIAFVVALLVRSIYFAINKSENPLFFHPLLDALFHHEWAQGILSGEWKREVFFRAPLYPYMLAFLYKISGSSMAFAVYVQHVLGSLSVLLVYFLAREFFAARVAAAAALIAALYWPLIYFEGSLLIVTLAVFLDLLFLLVLQVAIRRGHPAAFTSSGLLLGLAAIARPNILIVAPIVPMIIYWAGRSEAGGRPGAEAPRDEAGGNVARGHGGSRVAPGVAWRRATLLVFIGLAVVVTPVLVRNYVVGRDIVPIASQGGVNFYIGNNPQSNGSQAIVPGARGDLYGSYRGATELAEKKLGRTLKPSQVSDYYFKQAWQFIVSSPSDAIALTLKKLYMFWAGVERSNSTYIQFFWEKFGLGRVPMPGFWLVGPLGLLGGVLLWPRRRKTSLLYMFIASYMIGVVAFFVNGRFRLPVAPALIVLSGFSLIYLFEVIRGGGVATLKVIGVLAVCVFIVDYDYVKFRGVRAFDEAVSYFEIGNGYLKTHREDNALDAFAHARQIQERYPSRGYAQISDTVDYNLGVLYYKRGQCPAAIRALERIRSNDTYALYAQTMLGDCYLRSGQSREAYAAYARVLSASPKDRDALIGAATASKRLGDIDGMERIIARMQSLYPNDTDIAREIRALRGGD